MSPRLKRNSRVLGLLVATWFVAGSVVAAQEVAPDKEPERNTIPTGPLPQFTPEGGIFTEAVSLHLAASSPSAVVRYTLDGTEPSAKSETYSRTLNLTSTALVRARVFQGNQPAGPTVSQTYTFLDRDLETFRSNLPLVIINTFGREIEHDNKCAASVRFIDPRNGRSSFLDPADFDGRADVH